EGLAPRRARARAGLARGGVPRAHVRAEAGRMKNVLAVAKREFRSAFDLPIAYVFIAAFLILAAIFGLLGFFDRGVSDLRDYFQGLRYAFVLFAPAVAMRL